MKSLQYATSHETTEPEAGDVYVALGEGWYVPLALDGLRLDGPKHQPPAARTLLQRVLSHLLSTKNPLTVDLSTLSQTWSMLPGSRLMDAASPEPAGTLYRSLPDGKKLNFQWSDVIPAEARQASTARDIAPSRSQGGLNK